MNAERRQRVEAVFLEVAEAPESERASMLAARCDGDEELRAEVQSLLEHHGDESLFLDHAELTELEEWTLPPGTRVAGFTIGAVLGTGGMGVVYVAEQDRPRRTVALKVIRLGRRGMLRRFEHEAEVLGRLQHPGIAQVYGAGAADLTSVGGPPAQPYIAMELVKGFPLDEYARRERLDVRRKLELMAEVCDAAQHAHQRSVIHRDLKPANILVDEGGRPRVLDFGVARATGADARETRQTGAGQLIGTLAYMSPEQMLGDPGEVDTRTDVYALGVILYQLLAGRLPHLLDGKPLAEAARITREEEPARLGTVDRALRGEVETIVAKALAKDRARRYQTAAELGQDIRRYLDGRSIAAKDDSAFYVVRKQLSRHRVLVGAGAVLLVLLIGFAAYATVQSRRNEKSAQSEARAKTEALESLKAAKDARALADQTSDRLKTELATSTVERGRLLARAGNLAAAEALLWPAHLRDPSSRQTRWALWELYSQQPCLATVPGHSAGIIGMTFSPDDRSLYSAGADGTVRVWDRAAAQSTGVLEGTMGTPTDLAVSPDGRTVATTTTDGQVILWDTAARNVRLRFTAHFGSARGVAFSPDGTRLVTGGNDKLVRLWDAATGKHLGDLAGAPKAASVTRVAWSGRWIACGAGNGDSRVLLWEGTSGEPVALSAHAGGVTALAISADGRMLASGANDREIQLWSVDERKLLGKLMAPNGAVLSLHFADDNATLVSTGWWSMDLWEIATRKRQRSLSQRTSALSSAISHDGAIAVAGLSDGGAQFWDAAPSAGKVWLPGHTGRVAAAFSPVGWLAATGDGEGKVRLWDGRDGALLATIPAHAGRVRSLRFSPDGRLLATGGEDAVARLWDLRSGTMLASVNRHSSISDDSLRFSPDGRLLAVIRGTGSISLMRIPDLGEETRIPSVGSEVVSARFSPDGRTIAACSRDHVVRLWPVDENTPRMLTPTPEITPWSLAFSPDGARLLVGDWARETEVWDVRRGREIGRLRGHSGLVASVEFDPADPMIAATSASDGTVRLWDLSTELTLATLDAFDGWEALSLSFSADGKRLLSSGTMGSAVIWDLSYFERHIAWNAESQIARLGAETGERFKTEELRAWARQTLSGRAAAGPGEEPGVTPEIVRSWGGL